MGGVKHFTDLKVWRRSHALFLDVLKDLDELPRTRAAAALTDQAVRSIGGAEQELTEITEMISPLPLLC